MDAVSKSISEALELYDGAMEEQWALSWEDLEEILRHCEKAHPEDRARNERGS